MNRNFKILFSTLLFLLPISVFAQPIQMQYLDRIKDSLELVNTAIKPPRVKKPPTLSSELSAGLRLNTDGYGLFFNKGFLRKSDEFGSENQNRFFQVRFLELEINELKNSKEIKANAALPGMNSQVGSYILGKINTIYQVKLGFGNRRLIAGKPDPKTISIHWVYLGGFSMALLKPYYLELNNIGEVKYADSIKADFTSPGNINGKAAFSKGFDELKFVPGLYVRTGLHFDFAAKKTGVSALEVGATATAYSQKLEQMAYQKPQQFFFSFYVSLQFGKKW